MEKTQTLKVIVGAIFVLIILIIVYFLLKSSMFAPTTSYIDRKLAREQETYKKLQFNLVDPSQAPESIRSLAREGYEILIDTKKNAAEYAGDKLSCTNCHFAGGDTTGGVQGGISLVGVATKYPAFDPRTKNVVDLPTRINYCFENSMNGTPVPVDSRTMLALVTYLSWISKDLPIYGKVPWLGLEKLTTTRQGNSVQGKRVYAAKCALCHRDDGQGGPNTPPLWGTGSFNRQAGMNEIQTLAAFIYWNMPYYDSTPVLSQDQAMDVAAYIISQPRS
jgi:thiosulfate dehydrogenase